MAERGMKSALGAGCRAFPARGRAFPAIAFALLLCATALVEGREFVQLPVKVLSSEREEYVLLSAELTAPSVVSVIGGGNSMVLDVSPDGYTKIAHVFGTAKCMVPIQGKNIEFEAVSLQEMMIWPVSMLRFTVEGDILTLEFTTPGWAITLEVERAEPDGVEVSYREKVEVVYSGQRVDTMLGPDGRVMLVRSGRGVPPLLPGDVGREEGLRLDPLPDGMAPPKEWYPQPYWTPLPFLPVDLEPDRPSEISP